MKRNTALNAICPYFTMFPLEFPLGILNKYAKSRGTVLDPFAGRGTTLFAGRLQGMRAIGIDSSAVAVAISEAKLTNTSPGHIITAARDILDTVKSPRDIPDSKGFWKYAFDYDVLFTLCRLREGLLKNCVSDSRKALRAIILGALHGPMGKHKQSYFSNQCPRTYAPKPRYATIFWKKHKMIPPRVDLLQVVKDRAERFFRKENLIGTGDGEVITGDSQQNSIFDCMDERISWIVTSPPYYGMCTYIPDQWLRKWFLGGPAEVDYSKEGQLSHSSASVFCDGLKKVWMNCASVASPACRLVIRFGAIHSREINALKLIKKSLSETPWRVLTSRRAGTASTGKRQAECFVSTKKAIEEYDVWAEMVA